MTSLAFMLDWVPGLCQRAGEGGRQFRHDPLGGGGDQAPDRGAHWPRATLCAPAACLGSQKARPTPGAVSPRCRS
ncbi:MAG: hypothetical protein CM15mP79_0810 [Methanobacteriota archaeon]|nr:MAG: hypothetical protein CM15mP79_0810 [Euryarchaeota archaeon]